MIRHPHHPIEQQAEPAVPCVLILSYFDGSGVRAAWGPYSSQDAAKQGREDIERWPIEAGKWEIQPLLSPLGRTAPPAKPAPVCRIAPGGAPPASTVRYTP